MQRFYTAVIERGDGGYGVFFPDLPGLTSWGDTVDEAASNALVAAQGHVALAIEHDEPLPAPTPLNKISVEKDIKVEARVIIPVETADVKVRVNITLPRTVLTMLDARADAAGKDRSAYIAELAKSAISR